MIDVKSIKVLIVVKKLKNEVETLGVAYNGAQREISILKTDLRRQSDRLINSQNDHAMTNKALDEVTDELIDVKHSYRQLEDLLRTMSASIKVFDTLGDLDEVSSTIEETLERYKID